MKAWTEAQCKARIRKLRDRYEGNLGLHSRIQWRQQEYYQRPEADPHQP